MAVYVDTLIPCVTNKRWRYTHSCHLIGDTEEELVAFAVSIGLKSFWIQRTGIVHFDLNDSKRKQAVKAGAIEIDRNQFVEKLRKVRQFRRKRKRIYAP